MKFLEHGTVEEAAALFAITISIVAISGAYLLTHPAKGVIQWLFWLNSLLAVLYAALTWYRWRQ